MKTLSLFGVFVVAKAATLIGRDMAWSASTPAVYFWQDAIVALLFAAMFLLIRNSRLQWALYVAAVLYVGLNTILVHVLSTPLTLPMFRAARGALADSILHYATWQNARLFMVILAAGAFFPLLFQRIPTLALRIVSVAALVFSWVGWNNAATADTAGLERNALAALALSAWPRLHGLLEGAAQSALLGAERPGSAREVALTRDRCADWRQSPFSIAQAESLAEFSGAAAGRNVVLIVLESTGARHLKTYGAALDPMPNLDRLANEAILFEHAYAVYPESIKALLPALCSRYPAFDLSAETHAHTSTASVAQVLAEDGYRTALFHSGRFIYLGMESMVANRGFALTEDAGDIGGNVNSSFGVDEPATIARILNWIDQLESGERFFLTYLPIAGHHPYETPDPRPFPESTDIDRYRNALFAGDHALGTFLDELKKRGLYEKTLFVIYGDHGEAFGEHEGNFGHTMFIFEENVRVPYLIALPGIIHVPRRVSRVASVIDTAPTILDLLGRRAPAGYQGVSLLDPRERMALLFTDYSLRFIGLRDGSWKFIDELGANRPKLFRLDRDPGERENLAAEYPLRTTSYRQHLMSWGRAQKELILSAR